VLDGGTEPESGEPFVVRGVAGRRAARSTVLTAVAGTPAASPSVRVPLPLGPRWLKVGGVARSVVAAERRAACVHLAWSILLGGALIPSINTEANRYAGRRFGA
jgi:hypothetical protein